VPHRTSTDDRRDTPAAANFATCLMPGIAYASSIGGLGTLIGTPPNLVLKGVLSAHGVEIGFGQWVAFAMPLVVVYLFVAWLLLTRVAFPIRAHELPGGRELIGQELARLGPLARGEMVVLVVFAATVLAWTTRGLWASWEGLAARVPAITRIDDTMIALVAAISLFFIPVDARRGVYALDWATAAKVPWGVLLLFGGGLSLAGAMQSTGLAGWMGDQVHGLRQVPLFLIVASVTVIVLLLTEVTSNTATATAFLPILLGVADGLKIDPLLLLPPAALAPVARSCCRWRHPPTPWYSAAATLRSGKWSAETCC
jgi:sodium-dependent dicarboxylate transporter 2/3/5